MVKQLLKRVKAIDAQDDNKLTALHYAVRRSHLEIVKALIGGGAGMYTEIILRIYEFIRMTLHRQLWVAHTDTMFRSL